MNKVMLDYYESGMTVSQIASSCGVSVGKAYNMLKASGCKFRKRGYPIGYKMPPEAVARNANARRGAKRSAETCAKISAVRRCHYNGLNGYGHTKRHPRGYVLAYAPEHPKAHADGYVMLHTIIMEQQLGRYLTANEVVHHINHKRDDNSPENLRLMIKKEHSAMHLRERQERSDAV